MLNRAVRLMRVGEIMKIEGVGNMFAESNQQNPDFVGILFVITIDPSRSTTPFAILDVDNSGNFEDEAEILFSMDTIFRIQNITPMDESERLFRVDLTLTNEIDEDLRALTDDI